MPRHRWKPAFAGSRNRGAHGVDHRSMDNIRTYTCRSIGRLFVHAVWTTFLRRRCLREQHAAALQELAAIKCGALDGRLVSLGVADNHVHILAQIPQNLAVVDLVRHVKGFTSRAMNLRFNDGLRWQAGYYAETVNWRDLERVSRYLASQRERHARAEPCNLEVPGLRLLDVDLNELGEPAERAL